MYTLPKTARLPQVGDYLVKQADGSYDFQPLSQDGLWGSPPAIGNVVQNTGAFSALTDTALTATQVLFASAGGLLSGNAGLTFQETIAAAGQGLHLDCVGSAVSGGIYGIHAELRYEPSAATTGTFVAIDALASVSNGGAFAANGGTLIGLVGETRLENGSTGIFATCYGSQFSVNNQSAATITAAYGAYFPAPQNSGGGSIATYAAIEIDALSGAGTAYAILTGGAGLVKIGDTTGSTAPNNGSWTTAGGAGIAQNLWVGGTGNFGSTLNANAASGLFITQAISAGGTRQCLTITPAANVSISSGVESPSVIFNTATRQWATSTPSIQREWEIQGPTYACSSTLQTIITAATLAITSPPIAGLNVSITNSYAIYSPSGNSYIGNGQFGVPIGGTAGNLFIAQSANFSTTNYALEQNSSGSTVINAASGSSIFFRVNNVSAPSALSLSSTQLTFGDAISVVVGSTTGTQWGTAANQKQGWWGATPIIQITGYGTPTGGSRQGTFAAGSITLANLAAAVAQLILDLKSMGLVGT